MDSSDSLNRFIQAQRDTYENAFQEVRTGRKVSHWMWFIFPQIRGLGHSEMAKKYAIEDLKEAERYLKHPILGSRLVAISKVLTELIGKTAHEIFGSPDDLKLRSCMTLFSSVNNRDGVFQQVSNQYFDGKSDENTLRLIS